LVSQLIETMRDKTKFSLGRLVVFDTNVVESRFVAPLLRAESLRDFALLQADPNPYVPAVAIKSVLEILHHAKLGNPILPWMNASLGYPGGVEEGWRILQQVPECASRHQLADVPDLGGRSLQELWNFRRAGVLPSRSTTSTRVPAGVPAARTSATMPGRTSTCVPPHSGRG
jgi:hypothetical protein